MKKKDIKKRKDIAGISVRLLNDLIVCPNCLDESLHDFDDEDSVITKEELKEAILMANESGCGVDFKCDSCGRELV